MENYNKIVRNIFDSGYYEIKNFYSKEDIKKLYEFALHVDSTEVMRNFRHPAYKLAVNAKLKELLFGIAHEKCRIEPKLTRGSEFIQEENIGIGFHRKGPTFNNSKMAKNAYHYDDTFITGVMPFKLPPQPSKGRGLNVYRNLKKKFGMNFFAKVISRALGRSHTLRKVFKPYFIPYTENSLFLFFGDITLHGVEDCDSGDRVSLSIQLSQATVAELKARLGVEKHKYLSDYE